MNRCILVVDDDPEATRAAAEVLESHGYQVLTPPNGQIALEQVLSERPWVVIAGETLPGGESGLDFVDRIAQALPIVPPRRTGPATRQTLVRWRRQADGGKGR
jgi:CheY-like chemotaxis protein